MARKPTLQELLNMYQIAQQVVKPNQEDILNYKQNLLTQAQQTKQSQLEDFLDNMNPQQPVEDYRLQGGYEVPLEQRPEFLRTYGQAMQEKANLAPQDITAGGRTATMYSNDPNTGQPVNPSAYTFSNEDLIPYQLAGIKSPTMPQENTRQELILKAIGAGLSPEYGKMLADTIFPVTTPEQQAKHEENRIKREDLALQRETTKQTNEQKNLENLSVHYTDEIAKADKLKDIDPNQYYESVNRITKTFEPLFNSHGMSLINTQGYQDFIKGYQQQQSWDAIDKAKTVEERNALIAKYQQGNIPNIEQNNQSETSRQEKVWFENGIKYRINPATGKKQRWVE